MKLCKKILRNEYEFVLSTHIHKGHIHIHIIFNNVNMVTADVTSLIRKAIIKSVIRAINYAKKTTYLSLMIFTKVTRKKIPSCKSILTPNLLWTSFIKYERTMEFTEVKRWRDNVSPSLLTILFF